MKTKNFWNSFTTDFFFPLSRIRHALGLAPAVPGIHPNVLIGIAASSRTLDSPKYSDSGNTSCYRGRHAIHDNSILFVGALSESWPISGYQEETQPVLGVRPGIEGRYPSYICYIL